MSELGNPVKEVHFVPAILPIPERKERTLPERPQREPERERPEVREPVKEPYMVMFERLTGGATCS